MIRSIFQEIEVVGAVTPYNIIQLKVFYPVMSDNAPAQSMGIIPANPQHAPFPVVIFWGGINCGWELYQWLAVKLAARGLVVVLDGGNKASTSIAQWLTLVSPFKRLCHCAIEVLYKF